MPHTPLRRAILAGLGAFVLAAAPAAVSAQQAADTPAAPAAESTDAAPPVPTCQPGAFGEGVSLAPRNDKDPSVTAVHLEFQCGDILSDGTYIPTGYRIQLEGECGDAPCDYPLAFLTPSADGARYEGSYISAEGDDVILRVRRNRGDTIVLIMLTRTPGEDAKPERARFFLEES